MRIKATTGLFGAGLLVLGAAATAQTPSGDVKAGVDAWQAGDYARAVADWQGPAGAGDPDAAFNLGQAYKYGRGVPQDLGRAIQLYGQAAQHGHKQAEANLGLLMFQTGDHAGAIPHLERAAAAGDPRAQYYLGTAYFNGDGVPVDQVKAYALMTRASASGLPPAANSLAQMDGYLSAPVRQKGIVMARKMAASQPARPAAQAAPQIAAAGPATPSYPRPLPAAAPYRPTPAPQAIATASLPPSAASGYRPAPAPQPAPVPAAPPMSRANSAPSGGAWRVQLGAYGDPAKARQLWETISRRFPALASAQPFLVHAGAVTRLQAGPFPSSAAAGRACAQTKAAGQDCIPVKP